MAVGGEHFTEGVLLDCSPTERTMPSEATEGDGVGVTPNAMDAAAGAIR